MPKKSRSGRTRVRKKSMTLWYILLLFLILIYALFNNIYVGFAVFLLVIGILILETRESVINEGIRKSVTDILVAIVSAVVIWVLLSIVLQTNAPVDAVASCSMLPTMHRGDLVVLRGISNMSQFIVSHKVPVVNVSPQNFSNFERNIGSEFLAYYAYLNGNRSSITSILPSANYAFNVGLYNTKCLTSSNYLSQPSQYYRCYVDQNQTGNLIKYNYSYANVIYGNSRNKIVQTSAISIGNTVINENFSNPIVVYMTNGRDSFSGDIIHRVVAAIRVNGTYYLLTRGDNNPALDMQFSNYPPAQNEVVGYVLTDIPVIGYLKLIISGELGTVPGCNQTITR